MNPVRCVVVTRAVSSLSEVAKDATAVALTEDAIAAADGDLVRALSEPPPFVIAMSRSVANDALAAALLSDFFALREGSTITLGSPRAAAALFWRLGPTAKRLLLTRQSFSAAHALALGICDALVPEGADSLQWLREWIGRRSLLALSSAAGLIRSPRSDLAEREEFARLFATGEPQRGLTGFLNKRPTDFSESIEWEIV